MRKTGTPILLLFVFMCCLWRDSYPSTSEVQTYLSKGGVVSSLQAKLSEPLFAQQMDDSTKVHLPNSLKLKSPYMAVFYSVIPGFVFHGSGHVYAGDISSGVILFGSELAGVGLMFLGGLGGFENGESTNGGDYTIFAGTVLFVGSWLYDIVESPMAAKKRNSKLLERKSMGFEFRMKEAEPKLVVVWRF